MKTLYERTMFKKTISVILIFTFLFSMTGCNKVKKIPADSEKMKSDVSETAQEETSDETEEEEESKEPEDTEETSEKTETTTTKKTNSGGGGSGGGSSPPTTEPTTKRETTTTTTKPSANNNNSSNTNSGTAKKETTTKKPETTTTTQAPTPQRDYGAAATFLSLLNSYRASLGLSQLGMEGFMQEFAMLRANEIINNYSHNTAYSAVAGCPTFDYQGLSGYKYNARGECIYGGAPLTPNEALAGFKASPGHNSILTFSEATHVGVGVVSYTGNNYYCVVTYSETNAYKETLQN